MSVLLDLGFSIWQRAVNPTSGGSTPFPIFNVASARTSTPSPPPRVSVIVPCYNGEEYVGEAIRSVLGQSLGALELIVLDDGSEDGSEAVIQGFDDARIVYVAKSNSGVADTRNQGVALARAPVIAFLDADDLFETGNLAKKLDFLDAQADVGLVHSDVERFDDSGRLEIERRAECVGDALHAILEFRTHVNGPCSAVIRKHLFHQVGGFDTRLSTAADRDLWIRLAARTRIGYIPESLARYRQHSGQMHMNIDAMENDLAIIYGKAREAGHFKDEAHAHLCSARAEHVLAGSYLHHTRQYGKVLKHTAAHAYHRLRHIARL
jgi:glycosyltransferase involved in cell wall biosynthesis